MASTTSRRLKIAGRFVLAMLVSAFVLSFLLPVYDGQLGQTLPGQRAVRVTVCVLAIVIALADLRYRSRRKRLS